MNLFEYMGTLVFDSKSLQRSIRKMKTYNKVVVVNFRVGKGSNQSESNEAEE